MNPGEINHLTLKRFSTVGAYLNDDKDLEVLLPNKYLTDEMAEGDLLEVFVYRDSEDRIVATTETPKLQLNEIVYLEVKDVSLYGVFVNWGLEKDLLVPYKEQKKRLEEGMLYPICLLLDEATDRLYGTTKIEKHFHKCFNELNEGDLVDLEIWDRTELGRKVIVNKKFQGLIFHNDISKDLYPGLRLKGFVRNVREDGKLDVSLSQVGKEKRLYAKDELLALLIEKGRIGLGDKSDPEEIRRVLGMSKKTFKQASGTLFKERLVAISAHEIVLLKAE